MRIIWDSVTGGFVALDDALRFTLDEPINYDERRDWWHELAPIYHAGHAQVCCTPRILVSTYVEWDCELLPITTAPLTVEADGEGLLQCRRPRPETYLDSAYFDGHDNCEFAETMLEVFTVVCLPRVTATACPPEVTL